MLAFPIPALRRVREGRATHGVSNAGEFKAWVNASLLAYVEADCVVLNLKPRLMTGALAFWGLW